MSRKVAFKTLGCRLNQFETDALVSRFDKAGYQVVEYGNETDVTIVNTCTVTNKSDQKSKNLINKAARISDKGVVVVTGCMADHYKKQLEQQDNITYVVDNARKSSIPELIDAHFKGEILHPEKMSSEVFGFNEVDKSLHTRAAVKIQDGCDNFCTFCIIPQVRGGASSRPLDEILHSVQQTINNGFKEIVVTGVNIGRYDYNGYRFEDVIERILDLPGDFRVRISSLEPDGFGERFLDLFEHPKLTPHLHLCLQSGSDRVLLRMRRMYDVKTYRKWVDKIRSRYPGFNLSTDVIVGFPGETEEDFRATADFIEDIGFAHVHTFKYSKRDGTRAARMDEQVPEQVKNERSEVIRELNNKKKTEYYRTFIGREQQVLTEKNGSGSFSGYGEHYVPVFLDEPSVGRNEFHRVRIDKVSGHNNKPVLEGKLI